MVAFAHFCSTRNIGDKVSAPYLYFDFPNAEFFDLRSPLPPREIFIYGGGAVRNELENQNSLFPAALKIAWGVGDTVHGATAPRAVPPGFRLYGSREWGQPHTCYVPCPSCMSPQFDRSYAVEHEAVLFLNADRHIQDRYPITIEGLPILANEADFETVIRFLASAEFVVTNSYHGAYWASLLGRRPILCRPYSSKFYSYKYQPPIIRDDNWRGAMPLAVAFPEALRVSRQANYEFHGMVMQQIKSFH